MPKNVRVEFVNLDGAVVEVGPHETILDAALDAGLSVPYSCGVGGCTACAARVVDGSAHQPAGCALSSGQIGRGFVLLCNATPTSDCRVLVGARGQRGLYDAPAPDEP